MQDSVIYIKLQEVFQIFQQIQKYQQKLEHLSFITSSLLMQQDKNQENYVNNVQDRQTAPYFKLIQIVGDHGKYQIITLVVWCTLWLVTGVILLGTPFLMFNPPYTCSQSKNATISNFSQQQCQDYVCSLQPSSRSQFQDNKYFKTISTSFIDLHCQKSYIVDILQSLIYAGCFFGYIFISILVDNMGRKKSLLLSFGITVIGLVIVALGVNLYWVGIGLFLAGYGSDSGINICFYFITETMEAKRRQKFCILIQVFFCLGSVVNIGYYYILKDWKLVVWIFLVVPTVICMGVIWKMVKDTPYFLVKLNDQQTVIQELSYIYKINNGYQIPTDKQNQLRQIVKSLQTRLSIKQSAEPQQQKSPQNIAHESLSPSPYPPSPSPSPSLSLHRKIYSPLDLLRYPSIRYTSISVCLISLFMYTLYYGPLMLISKLSYNMYINALVVTLSQLVTFPFSYFLIHRLKRRCIGIVLFGVCGISSFVLYFVIYNLCDSCQFLKIFELILIFIFRFCSSLQFAIFLVYTNQVFPTQIRGMGLGISSALGTIASTSSPYIFGSHLKSNTETAQIMIVFIVFSVIAVGLWYKLPQTLGEKIKNQIQEVRDCETEGQGVKQGKHIQLVQVKQGN